MVIILDSAVGVGKLRGRKTRVEGLQLLRQQIILIAQALQLWLLPMWVCRDLNQLDDKLSEAIDYEDVRLDPQWCMAIEYFFRGRHNLCLCVDRFANQANAQVPFYASLPSFSDSLPDALLGGWTRPRWEPRARDSSTRALRPANLSSCPALAARTRSASRSSFSMLRHLRRDTSHGQAHSTSPAYARTTRQ